MSDFNRGWGASSGRGMGVAEMSAGAWEPELLSARAGDLRRGVVAQEYGSGDQREKGALFRGGCEGGLDLRSEGQYDVLWRTLEPTLKSVAVVFGVSNAIGVAVMEVNCPHCRIG